MSYKRNRRTGFWSLFVGLMLLLLTACGNNQGFSQIVISPPTAVPQGTAKAGYDQQIYRTPIVGSNLDIATFDPALVQDDVSYYAVTMNFNGLVGYDNALQIQPELAESYQESSDGLQWIFHLHHNLTFSDGTSLTSRDVAYSLDRALQPATKSPVASSYLGLIVDADKLNAGKIKTIIGDSILTPDPYTVIIKVVKKASYFLQTLTYPTAYVVEKSLIDKYGNTNFTEHLNEGGGAGPFIVSKYIHKQEIDFVPNPYYYKLKPVIQKAVILFFADSEAAYRAYQEGQIDTVAVPPNHVQEALQMTNEVSQTPRLAITYLAPNFLIKPFDNLHIRQAFALAINRQTIDDTIYNGAVIATYHIIPQGMIGYRSLGLVGPENVQDTRGSASAAQHYLQVGLQEEGWSSVSQMPPIKLTYQRNSTGDKLINLLVGMWKNVLGVNVTPDAIDFNTLIKEQPASVGNPHGLQFSLAGWVADYPDPQDWTTLQFDKGSPENFMNYGQNNSADAAQEQAIQQQLEQADAETDLNARIQLYQNAEQQLVNQVAWIPLFQSRRTGLLKPYVQGLVSNALGIRPPTEWANIYIAAH